MEFFTNNKAVRLRSHLDKYLVADDDQKTTRQSRNGEARRARWLVELVDGNPDFIRLKSCYGRYLTASNEPFLLKMSGKKVIQSMPEKIRDLRIEWRAIRDAFQVKLIAYDGSYLRANGGTPPWRNSITHDIPQSVSAAASVQNWILWDVEGVEVPENESLTDYLSLVSSFSSVSDELCSLDLGSPMSMHSGFDSPMRSINKTSEVKINAMDIFRTSKAIRLQSVHNKYLNADKDEVSVTQRQNALTKSAKWTVELVENANNIIRLKSCYNKYLTASNHPFLLGMTGRKVLQTLPGRVDSSVEWEPIKEGNQIRLKSRYGQFLRANAGLPPWRNSITHDIPHQSVTQDWVVWNVHVVEIVDLTPLSNQGLSLIPYSGSFTSASSSPSSHSSKSASFSRQESGDSLANSPPKAGDGRTIYYQIADEYGDVEEGLESQSLTFKGNGVEELTKRLEMETGLDSIVVCTRSPLNGKLYPLRLQLPPCNAIMNVVVAQSSQKVSRAMPVISLPLNIQSVSG